MKLFIAIFFSLLVYLPISKANNLKMAHKTIAEIIKLKGSATKLIPGALEASRVEIGDKLVEDTSILTSPKSFLKIKFHDGSFMVVGSESKVVIREMKSTEPSVISLLKGKIRTQVQKELETNTTENKFYIRTKTAALGVRGTDFQTIYNPENNVTSLLTFKGEVAMAKIDRKTHEIFEPTDSTQSKVIERNSLTNEPTLKEIPQNAINENEELKKILASKETVVVPSGQNSFSSDSLKKTSLPVLISPVQLDVLYQNSNLEEKASGEVREIDLKEDKLKSNLSISKQSAPSEGMFNEKTGDFAPKSGGFVDLKTGLYVAPLNENVGSVDSDTGQYITPKGLVLDATKGFIVEDGTTDNPQLYALKNDLNQAINREVVVGNSDTHSDKINLNEMFVKNNFLISFISGKESLDISTIDDHAYIEDSDYFSANFTWQLATKGRMSPELAFGYSSTQYQNLNALGFRQDSKGLVNMAVGLKYAISKRFSSTTRFSLNQSHYAELTSNSLPKAYSLKRIVVSHFSTGLEVNLYDSRKWNIKAGLTGLLNFRKRFNTLVILPRLNHELKLGASYKLSNDDFLGLGFFQSTQNVRIQNTLGEVKEKRERSGLEFSYGVNF